jgi:acetoin utilization protein AcuC
MGPAALIYHPDLADFDLGEGHPMNPVRLALTVELMEAYGLLDSVTVLPPRPATMQELSHVHALGYIEAVQLSSDWGAAVHHDVGLGTDDNPIYPGMHDAAALVAGASIVGLEEVLAGRFEKTFSIAGGMHHAHRGRASGFSVYNDACVAIAAAQVRNPGIKVLYLDVDAHHGDGVQSTFAGSSDVMTVSIHASGLYAFPGTGFPIESGYGAGEGHTVNVPLPRGATDECLALAFEEVVKPVTAAFRPHVIVAQLGVDAHHADPQAELHMTLPGYRHLVRETIALAEKHCGGRLAALGGGGYHVLEIVPRAWTWVMAELAGVELPEELPLSWRDHARALTGEEPPTTLGADDGIETAAEDAERLLEETRESVAEVRAAVFPHHAIAF